MIDRLPVILPPPPDGVSAFAEKRQVLRMTTSDRTSGSIPVWEAAATARQEVEESLALAQAGQDSSGTLDSKHALDYRPIIPTTKEEEFGFADLVDMVNPLQHIPVVGHLYRKITGDQIKPAGKVIGSAVFGGPAGLAGGLVNLILEKETGRDAAGNIMALVTRGELPRFVNDSPTRDLPGELLSFADLSHPERSERNYYAPHPRSMWGND